MLCVNGKEHTTTYMNMPQSTDVSRQAHQCIATYVCSMPNGKLMQRLKTVSIRITCFSHLPMIDWPVDWSGRSAGRQRRTASLLS